MNGITLVSIAAILLVVFMTKTSRQRAAPPPQFGKVIDTDEQEYTFYEF